ncbi:MAG: hypothetical protein M3T55_08225 [Pseudomonadota bacterium]|nr:hypothetical protein [Pseudomonadota bacterium]
MFIGHYAAALAAKSARPRAPLWAYVGACQLLDIVWGALLIAGVEKVRFNPALPGSELDLYFMPYTHSLPASLAWSAAAAVFAAMALRLPRRVAALIGATVFSHWVLDFLVHRPDLELWFGGPKVGLGWWNYPLSEMALEMGLVAIAGAAWVATRKTEGRTAWPAVLFIAILVAVQIVGSLSGGGGGDASRLGAMALATYLAIVVLAIFIDRGPRAMAAPARAVG